MAGAAAQNQPDLAMSHEPKLSTPMFEANEKEALAFGRRSTSESLTAPPVEFEADLEGEEPTEEDLATLPRISGKIPWLAFTVAFVELCERFGYYGCQVLCTSLVLPFCAMFIDELLQTPTSSSVRSRRGSPLVETQGPRASLVLSAWVSARLPVSVPVSSPSTYHLYPILTPPFSQFLLGLHHSHPRCYHCRRVPRSIQHNLHCYRFLDSRSHLPDHLCSTDRS